MADQRYRIRLGPDLTAETSDTELAERQSRAGYRVTVPLEGGA